MTNHAEGALPAPLTPAECNLQDFAFMPLDVARLRDSDMAAYESPEACWAAVLLWSAAWHQVPAASLPDDDRFLAKAAGYGRVVKEWMNVREGALHGWVRCADGRLYHPVVAEKANESWYKKVHYAWEKECDRIRKANKKREQEGKPLQPFPPEPALHSVQIPAERDRIPAESQTNSVGNDAAFQTADEKADAAELVGVASAAQESSTDDDSLSSKDNEGAFPLESEGIPPESVGDSAGNENTSAGIPLENALKGQGEGQGQGELTTTSSARASTEAHEDDDGSVAPLPTDRNVQIALLLRAQGIQTTAQNPVVAVTWAQNPKVTDDVLNRAIAKAKAAKGDSPVPLGYLFPIVEQLLQAPDAQDAQVRTAPAGRPEKFDPIAHVNRNRIAP